MKNWFKKTAAMFLMTAMVSSIGLPAFANEKNLTEQEKEMIRQEICEQYDVELVKASDAVKAKVKVSDLQASKDTISEEEFRLHVELLAVMGAIGNKGETRELRERYTYLVNELDRKYPVQRTKDENAHLGATDIDTVLCASANVVTIAVAQSFIYAEQLYELA